MVREWSRTADWHVVMFRGKECGTILYDSKNHNQFRTDHVSKLRADQLSAKADHAILSTHKFPQGTRQLHFQAGLTPGISVGRIRWFPATVDASARHPHREILFLADVPILREARGH